MVYRLNINVMQSYRNLWSCFLFVHAVALYIHVWLRVFFIIPVFEHARAYLVQLATDRFWGRYLDAAGLDSMNQRSL